MSNADSNDVTISWDGESAELPARESLMIASESAELVLSVDDEVVASVDGAAAERCQQDVGVTKIVDGPATAGTTYTIQVSRLVGGEYVPEAEPFELRGGESITVPLDSTFDPEGITYRIEEIDAGGAHGSSVTPDTFVVNGHRGETIDVVVTNSYAAIRIDKTASAETVQTGGQLTYTLEVANVGAFVLAPVVVYDLLPPEVSLDDGGAIVAGGAGACSLAKATRPELVRCELYAPLPPGATAPAITLTVVLDPGLRNPDPILNQAQAIGVYDAETSISPDLPTVLSCEPTTGLVCDLSAEVATGVEIVVVEAATTTSPSTTTTTTTSVAPSTTAPSTTAPSTTSGATTTTVTSQIAVAGSGSSRMFIMIGALLILIGGALVLGAHVDDRTDPATS